MSQEKTSSPTKEKYKKKSLRSFNDDKQEASVADDCFDNGGFDVLFVIVIYIENRVLQMNSLSAPATKKWLRENCGTDNLFLCRVLEQIEVRKCMLSFGAESVVFQVAIQKFEDQDI